MSELKVGDNLYKYGFGEIDILTIAKVTEKQVRAVSGSPSVVNKDNIDCDRAEWFTTLEACKTKALGNLENRVKYAQKQLDRAIAVFKAAEAPNA